MAHGIIYRMRFSSVDDALHSTFIFDNLSVGAASITYYDIEPAEDNPITLSIIDNDEEKFSPIRAKQLEINFLSSGTINLNNFISGDDRRFYVEHYVGTQIKFKGYLVLTDNREDFLESETRNTVTLTATDNLGSLKDLPLVDLSGKTPGKATNKVFRILDYIAYCLYQTGLQLPIYLANNVMEESTPGIPFYASCFLNSKTFETEVSEREDCYTVLEKILGEQCYLSQVDGKWWILNVDEITSAGLIVHHYNFDGAFIETFPVTQYSKTIGRNQPLFFSGEKTFVSTMQPVREVKETYNYQNPKELIDNIDFSRGDLLSPILIPPIKKKRDNGQEYTITGAAYKIDDWTAKRGTFTANATVTNATAYTIVKYDGFLQIEKYIRLNNPTPAYHWLESNPLGVGELDKINFSFDWRTSAKATVLGYNVSVQLILKGDDGKVWALEGDAKSFLLGVPNVNYALKWVTYSGQQNTYAFKYTNVAESTWRAANTNGEIPPIPANGDLYFCLPFAFNDWMEYSNLTFDITPYIAGSYQKITGHSHTISQTKDLKAAYEETVSMGDAPRTYMKGAIMKFANGKYQSAGRFYDGATFSTGLPADIYLHPFGHIQAFSVWNQKRRIFRLFDYELQGDVPTQGFSSDVPEIMDKYLITASSPHATNKIFMPLHYEQNYKLCEMTGVLAEVDDTSKPKDYDSKHEFKYRTE